MFYINSTRIISTHLQIKSSLEKTSQNVTKIHIREDLPLKIDKNF